LAGVAIDHLSLSWPYLSKGNFMPWSSEGGNGGSWKPGGPGPWGPKPGGTSPEFEEFLKRGQEKLKQFMPGSGGVSSAIPAIGAERKCWHGSLSPAIGGNAENVYELTP
jgi:hypothetical protein